MPISPYIALLLLASFLLLPSDVWKDEPLLKRNAWQPPNQRYCEPPDLWPLKLLCERRSVYLQRATIPTSSLSRFDF